MLKITEQYFSLMSDTPIKAIGTKFLVGFVKGSRSMSNMRLLTFNYEHSTKRWLARDLNPK